ncbi:conserved exported hypothetical protein [Paraburkholderia tropica]|uniref:hypothetical protein n=1 Tax=Paraburkholderia tropica TaxID=92647 RepID=UPI001CB2F5F4|nr:hypothetical protein [Paraburkholderia tropica]CAG9216938.1 conserved exported hypothetical protein [Paraburkholderia tropica]
MKKELFAMALIAVAATVSLQARADEPLAPPPHGAPAFAGEPGLHPPFPGPGFDVINDLEQLRRLYSLSGHADDIVQVYHEVLNKSHDPVVRRFTYDALAREQLKPADPAAAIATLHASLEEDIERSNKAPRFDGAPKKDAPRP